MSEQQELHSHILPDIIRERMKLAKDCAIKFAAIDPESITDDQLVTAMVELRDFQKKMKEHLNVADAAITIQPIVDERLAKANQARLPLESGDDANA